MMHFKCRNGLYPRTQTSIIRQSVPDDKVSWDIEWPEYNPPNFTSEHILNQSWADPEMGNRNFKPLWNEMDGKISRISFHGNYSIEEGVPLNPIGRTGLRGRGILGRWGPNHAADPIITRWKKVNSIIISDYVSQKPVLQFVAIKRRDCNEWAIPGGMVDPGEKVTSTLKREFLEEALNSLEMSSEQKSSTEKKIEEFFSLGEAIYTGYVDDIRNTDNAWMETTAYNFHDGSGNFVGSLNLNAGDDAIGVTWLDLSRNLPLYASHSMLLELVSRKQDAHW